MSEFALDKNTQHTPEELIGKALDLMQQGLHLQSKHFFEKAKAFDPKHPSVTMFIELRNRRYEQRGEYYDEPVVECCGCRENLSSCACKALCCDACCIPGGCIGPC